MTVNIVRNDGYSVLQRPHFLSGPSGGENVEPLQNWWDFLIKIYIYYVYIY